MLERSYVTNIILNNEIVTVTLRRLFCIEVRLPADEGLFCQEDVDKIERKK